MINDWFDFGGSKVMDAFMSLFPVFDLVMDKCLKENEMAFCPELLHRKMVDCFGINIQSHPIYITYQDFKCILLLLLLKDTRMMEVSI
jgi:hypothetical protein